MTLQNAKTIKEVISLKRDNFSIRDFTIMAGKNEVFLCEQKRGESPTQQFSMSKKMFNFLVKQYQKEQ